MEEEILQNKKISTIAIIGIFLGGFIFLASYAVGSEDFIYQAQAYGFLHFLTVLSAINSLLFFYFLSKKYKFYAPIYLLAIILSISLSSFITDIYKINQEIQYKKGQVEAQKQAEEQKQSEIQNLGPQYTENISTLNKLAGEIDGTHTITDMLSRYNTKDHPGLGSAYDFVFVLENGRKVMSDVPFGDDMFDQFKKVMVGKQVDIKLFKDDELEKMARRWSSSDSDYYNNLDNPIRVHVYFNGKLLIDDHGNYQVIDDIIKGQ